MWPIRNEAKSQKDSLVPIDSFSPEHPADNSQATSHDHFLLLLKKYFLIIIGTYFITYSERHPL